ncbi:MAG TPA: dinitrogenase iron-molybdenum cofactor biosynthesis protein [Spirochaetia bacterium]|nr:MAG: hypothetical protein A2Y41_09405 [Spirochaetes bacterium GWB1_36_13]HCL56630.1 dinitrogenase iron-molybdenum cofactor biosynthesis protein [Spirochaetia bacterium]
MKIAISSTGQNLTDYLDPRFGRANWLCIYDTESGKTEFIENVENFNASHGAGIQTAVKVVSSGASHVFSGHFGPKAADTLKDKVKSHEIHEEIKIVDLIEKIKSGQILL